MNGKHRAPRTYTHIEKIRIMNDAIVFMFGCMTLICEIRVGSFLFFEMNVLLLLLGTAEICLACFMYYQEFISCSSLRHFWRDVGSAVFCAVGHGGGSLHLVPNFSKSWKPHSSLCCFMRIRSSNRL